MGQTSGAGTQLVVNKKDAWSLSADLIAGFLRNDTKEMKMLRTHPLTWMMTSKSRSSPWITARCAEFGRFLTILWLCSVKARLCLVCMWEQHVFVGFSWPLREQVNHQGWHGFGCMAELPLATVRRKQADREDGRKAKPISSLTLSVLPSSSVPFLLHLFLLISSEESGQMKADFSWRLSLQTLCLPTSVGVFVCLCAFENVKMPSVSTPRVYLLTIGFAAIARVSVKNEKNHQ